MTLFWEKWGKHKKKVARQELRVRVKSDHPSLLHVPLHMDQAMAVMIPFRIESRRYGRKGEPSASPPVADIFLTAGLCSNAIFD